MYENMESGPSHYSLLGVGRDSSLGHIKKAYRGISLELHPDKNKAPEAAVQFNQVTQAFDILSDKEKRREYNRLGDAGVATSAQQVIDHKYLLIQMIVYYASTVIFAFMMTFSEPTGDAFSVSLFGLIVMLFLEMLLVVQEMPLPAWFLPSLTAHDIISTMHRLFPAFMNGCRCVTGAFHVDRKAARVEALDLIASGGRDMTMRAGTLGRVLSQGLEVCEVEEQGGLMERSLRDAGRRVQSVKEGRDGTLGRIITHREELIRDPKTLRKSSKTGSEWWVLARDVGVYVAARFLFVKAKKF